MDASLRALSETEKLILEKLISAIPAHSAALRAQIESCRAKICDEFGSLEIVVSDKSKLVDLTGPIVTGQQDDIDTREGYGPYINFILFVRNGVATELQVYKDDGSPIKTPPNPEKFNLVPRFA